MGIMERVFQTDTSRDFTEKELLEARKQYFSSYKLKEDESLTNKFELVCSNCKTSRYFQHNDFVVTCNCSCQSRKLEEEKELERKKQNMLKLEKLKDASLLGERYKEATFDILDMNRPSDFINAVQRCKTYCEKWTEVNKQGLGIYLYGDVGTGKSLLTACIGNYLLSKMIPVLFTNFFEIAKQIKKSFNTNTMSESDFIERLASIDLLIIDDIGTEIVVKNGEKTWIQDKIYDVINARYINNKPTIFSSNESLVELVENCGLMKKTVDRIAAMSTAKIKLQGSSYRLIEQTKATTIF